ncbi:RNA-directed DNA polymerase, eukaryota, reverse transcriptase zinc-binding domain protein [Tanacetum coccineum]
MEKIGFCIKWRSWIKGCLLNARASVLVNGSPTNEFEIFRGLRQGDPLSPFLFILAMEGLHAFICKAINMGIYKGISIGNNLRVSHLIYADDVIFIGDWSLHNTHNLICILRCFFLVSGLKINVNKSKISGICISDEDILVKVNVIGYGAANIPFKYLGVPIGYNMARCSNWDPVMQKLSTSLSHWKARLLSVGGRLTLIKSVLGSLPIYFMSLYKVPNLVCNKLESMRNQFFLGSDLEGKKMTWVSWKKCLASKKTGVLAIYGQHGGIFDGSKHRSNLSPWCGILSSINSLKLKGIDLLALCIRKLGNGASIRFWEDVWHGTLPLKSVYPRVYLLESERNSNVANRVSLLDWSQVLRRHPRGGIEATKFADLKRQIGDVVLSDHNDAWVWSPNTSKGFSVASARSLIDSHILDVSHIATRWNGCIPIKVNIFLWKLLLNKLPSRVNLDRRGIDVPSILCPICQEDVEMANHIFSHVR